MSREGTPSRVRLEVDDYQSGATIVLDGWEGYDLSSDMMSAAGSFDFRFAPTPETIAAFRAPGQECRVYVDDLLQLTGIVDVVKFDTTDHGLVISISGRDMGGLLVDAVPPMLTLKGITLGDLAEKLIEPFRPLVRGVILSNEANVYQLSGKRVGRTLKKFSGLSKEKKTVTRTRPEDRVWDTLVQVAQEAGCHIWVSCDGWVVISSPNYAADPSIYGEGLYVLCDSQMRATDSNCRITHSPSISQRSSSYVVLGQGAPNATSQGVSLAEHAFTVKDPSPAFWTRNGNALGYNRLEKFSHQSVKNIADKAHVRHVARARMETRAVDGYGMTATVPGHRLTQAAPLWAIDTQVRVRFDYREIDALHYIRGRTFSYSDGQGQTTTLNLIPSGIWLASPDINDSDYERDTARTIWW